MKPLSVITLIKESKALFLFVLLSIITHTSIFLINPTFSFTISDKWEGSKGRFLVELRERKAPDLPHPDAAKSVSHEIGGFKNEKRGAGSNSSPLLRKGLKSVLPGPLKAGSPSREGSKTSKRNKPVRASKERKGDTGPLQSAQGDAAANEHARQELTKKTEEVLPLPTEKKGQDLDQPQNVASVEPVTESVKEEDARGDVAKPLMAGGEEPLSSAEEGKAKEPEITDDAPQPKAAAINPVDQPQDIAPAQLPTDPRNEEVAKADIKENAPESPLREGQEPIMQSASPPAEVEAVPTAPEERVETHMSQGLTKADENQPHPHLNPLPEGEDTILPHPLQGEGRGGDGVFSGQDEIEVKEPERKEEGKSEVMASEESQPHPHPFDAVRPEPVEGLNDSQDRPAPLPEVEGNSDVQTNIKIEATEKEKEPSKVVEQNVEPPAKKKKRTIHFHKILEPEKEATIGIPIGRPVVKITAPSKKKVSSRVQGISGRAQGNGVSRATLSANGENAVITVQNGRFLWDTVLREGKNIILASVWDMEGYSSADSVTVEVLSPKNSFELSINEPAGGEVESPVAMVRGRVEDVTVDTVRLIVNGEFVETPVDDGYFEKTVFLKERENTLQAEAINPAGLTARSGVLKVAVKNPMVPDILLHLFCDGHDMESHPKVALRERSQLDDEKGAVSDVDVIEMMSANEGYWEKVFAVEEARDGAYTLKVSGGRDTDCKLVVTLNSSKKKVRVFGKRLLEGQEWAVGRFLFPEGVFWDEDEWFSGRIEDKDSISKYRSPEGVTWKELKEGP